MAGKKKDGQLSMLVQAEIDMSAGAVSKMQKQLDKISKQLQITVGAIAQSASKAAKTSPIDVKVIKNAASSMQKLKDRVDASKLSYEDFLKYAQKITDSQRFLSRSTDAQAKAYRILETVQRKYNRAQEETARLNKKVASINVSGGPGGAAGIATSNKATSGMSKMEENALVASVRRWNWINDQKRKADKDYIKWWNQALNQRESLSQKFEDKEDKRADQAVRYKINKDNLYAAQKKKLLEDIQHFEFRNAKLLKSKATTNINGVAFSSDSIAEEIKVLKTQVNSASGPMTEFAGRFKQLGRNAEYVRNSIKNQTKDGYGLITMAEIAAKKVAIWAASTLAIYGPLRLIGSGIQYVIDLDNALNEIRIVTGQSQEEVEALAGSYNKLAQEMSVTTKEITEQAAELYRQGLSQSEVEDRMKAIITYSKISGISMEESNKIITATANATERSVTDIINVFALLGDKTAAG